jgi:hypothetical protein
MLYPNFSKFTILIGSIIFIFDRGEYFENIRSKISQLI